MIDACGDCAANWSVKNTIAGSVTFTVTCGDSNSPIFARVLEPAAEW